MHFSTNKSRSDILKGLEIAEAFGDIGDGKRVQNSSFGTVSLPALIWAAISTTCFITSGGILASNLGLI